MSRFSSLFKQLLLTGGGALALLGCTDDKVDGPIYNFSADGSNVFVLNEGKYGTPNGAVSYFSKTKKQLVDKSVFQTVNQRELGDVVQSMAVLNGQGYIVANNSQKVEVVNMQTFQTVATIKGLEQPRYMVAVGGKAYVSEWINFDKKGRVAVIDLATNTVKKTIAVGMQPEQLLVANGRVYVGNTGDDTLRVINPATDAVEAKIKLKDAPGSLVLDKVGAIWVLCQGITKYDTKAPYAILSDTPGNLVKFAPATPTAQTVLPFAGHPRGLRLNAAADQLYYRHAGGVYRMATTATSLPATPLIRRSFYGMDIDPKDNTIYGSVAPFSTTGKFIRYQETGAAIDSFDVNIGPNGFVFY
ncbi:40-residue YVTN family beta-propeller repeat-containing protein [Hymenobacter daecheongensis DSM 21074]|uniref:40-residue YVTN family beta-propeller repeat-containing protein n=1 Tax=Hymenobacter daecheongensis DSM 21074 TaxID=1121955 RepID=A0A1M6DFU0_9BACT|nr:DUF5074 domain-containing protein [Hymenobacter daecheongensis]SHI72011.1 40-residue YVTN family beta-propeller repeat-containing protein [Hymenobacter daecheongensis DSM 21074]